MQAILFSEVGVKLHFQTLIVTLIVKLIVVEIVLAAIRVSLLLLVTVLNLKYYF